MNHLDEIVLRVAKGDITSAGNLSVGERLYVALAANNIEMLERDGYTIAEALARLGNDWVIELVERWQYRGNPRGAETISTKG